MGPFRIIKYLVQVNLFQKLATSAEHFFYQNCSKCQNKTKTTICVHNMFCRYSELTIFMNNEQSVIILWVSWCKNKSYWQRFTCTTLLIFHLHIKTNAKFLDKIRKIPTILKSYILIWQATTARINWHECHKQTAAEQILYTKNPVS